jgi:peptide/nickel transport system substrate-binding protein
MRLSAWRWLAASSLVIAACSAGAETRPQYGGTLHIAMREALSSIDPAQEQTDSSAQANVAKLIFETLITIDEHGHMQGALAISWQASPDNRRWRLRLRPGVRFHDGTVLTPEIAVASLRTANPSWHVTPEGDSLVIEQANPTPELLSELALARNAICIRDAKGTPTGTGPFRVAEWQAGKRLLLTANDDYWGGRPFLDSIEIEMDKSFRDQMMTFQSGKADIIDIAPEQAQRVPIDRDGLRYSLPMELLGLVFTHEVQSSDEKLLRQALALSIDRGSIGSVLLQGAAQPAGSLLPNWMTGYGFVFSNQSDVAQARHLREQVQSVATWTLSYDGGDPLSRLIAERISLNAKDAGLSVRPASTTNPDLQLMRISLDSPDPWIALERLTTVAGLPVPAMQNDSVESLYSAEESLLATERIIPLFHLPVAYAISREVKNSILQKDGSWDLADVWLENRP